VLYAAVSVSADDVIPGDEYEASAAEF
jgi:hypothetical protein